VTVHFIGAGPGDPELLTLRAAKLIEACPVCLYAGALVPTATLALAPDGALLLDTQDLDLDEIVAAMAEAHGRGEDVARLHSGDLSIYSAVAEQARRLDRLGISWEMTPGVPAFGAVAAALGRELTVPALAQTVILTRYGRHASPMPAGEEMAGLAAHGATLVVHLGASAIEEIVAALAPHYGEDCPAAVVARATLPDELVLRGTLETIPPLVRAADVRRTATIVVGPALAASGFRDSRLYSTDRERTPR
jgi:precorrin-4/cobalt-precorrin-4 C11-methyltransferase